MKSPGLESTTTHTNILTYKHTNHAHHAALAYHGVCVWRRTHCGVEVTPENKAEVCGVGRLTNFQLSETVLTRPLAGVPTAV
jgi:hypothetical protein